MKAADYMNGALPLKKTFISLALLSAALFALLLAALLQIWHSESDIHAANQMRYQSYLLADELRESSDNLTRLARTYVVTGNPKYEKQYWDILDIRNGKKPRPLHYERIYWDFVAAGNPKPSPDGETAALTDLMKQAGFTNEEFAKLKEAQDNSDALVHSERVAMNAIKGLFADDSGLFTRKGAPDPELARRLMNDDNYHQNKARIMQPVNEFLALLDARTGDAVTRAAMKSREKFFFAVVLLAISLVITLGVLKLAYRSLINAESELVQHRDRLAEIVAEATADLKQANKELESFSYSVSHDLRTPLRAIDGFSQILSKNYAPLLDARGQDYLSRIRNATQRMGTLIDDLLHLSRVSRKETTRSQVDLTQLAHDIAQQLQQAAPSRQVDFIIAPDMTLDADPQLIRIVLENLMGNAWKFSGKRSNARIEVGMQPAGNSAQAVFVRDNGAGFNMEYAHKLFNAFQRLHAGSEFEGTGIGLATVQRIIGKHGGHAWAEGKEGEGATFYFSCGPS